MTTFVEEDGDAEIIHHREHWTNEFRLVYTDGRVLKLTETPAKKEGEGDGECTLDSGCLSAWALRKRPRPAFACGSTRYIGEDRQAYLLSVFGNDSRKRGRRW